MQVSKPNLILRDDTILGVCEALGEDLGFNPLYLRVTLAALLLWYPVAVLAGYAAAGLVVAFSRLVVRKPRSAAAQPQAEAAEAVALHSAANTDAEMAEAA
jgi:phage shock protein C